jgi:hypothetical protein
LQKPKAERREGKQGRNLRCATWEVLLESLPLVLFYRVEGAGVRRLDRSAAAGGLIIASLGAVMQVLLYQLGTETYRSYLSPYVDVTDALIAGGVVIAAWGLVRKPGPSVSLPVDSAVRGFSLLALANAVAASAFVIPVLVPSFDFPILVTRWPGVYMVIGYVSFVLVAVLGNVGWGGALRALSGDRPDHKIYRWPFVLQVAVTTVGAYGVAAFMFIGGYVGASLNYQGIGDVTVGTAMEVAVVPAAISIFAVVFGEMAGVANLLASLRRRD